MNYKALDKLQILWYNKLCSYNTSKIPPVGVGSGAWQTCERGRLV